ncbi:carboxymuconolactone decarboxylase family protein [Dichotomicrobium thermohalophilum]|nr:carboxymuconolactone decarboxylase family protein [Dichotomicrobium thermohalophilum]
MERIAGLFGGTVPNLYRVLAKSPAALRAFVEMKEALDADGHLSPAEQALVALEVSVQTDCSYCESVFVGRARELGVEDQAIKSICSGETPPAGSRQGLILATRRITQTHGRLGRHEIVEFEEQGLDAAKLLEIITIVSAYTLATYTNNLMRTRIDPEFRLPPDDVCGES